MEILLLTVFIALMLVVPALAFASLVVSVMRTPQAPTPEDRVLDRRL